MTRRPLALALLFALSTAAAVAQDARDPRVTDLDGKAARLLAAYARRCETTKAPATARRAWRILIQHYDADHDAGRTALGYRKKGDAWLTPDPTWVPPPDTCDARQHKQLSGAWNDCKKSLTRLHRELGVALRKSGDDDEAAAQLRTALRYTPDDESSHKALGHEKVAGVYGSAEQHAFVRRMREMRDEAGALRDRTWPVTPLADADRPKEVRALGVPVAGVRTEHFTLWTVDSAEHAAEHVQWAERSFAMMQFLLGSEASAMRAQRIQWVLYLRTTTQHQQLLLVAPNTAGGYSPEDAMRTGGGVFRTDGGQAAMHLSYRATDDADSIVAHVVRHHLDGQLNQPLYEGVMHAVQWLLCDTMKARYGSLAVTESSGGFELPPDASTWHRLLQDVIEQDDDHAFVRVPGEPMANFREEVRLKTWAAMLFLVARAPDGWRAFATAVADPKLPREQIEDKLIETIGLTADEFEEEFHAWARRGSPLGRASGW
ncbi:MAG: hypothetical protein H6835_14355 [Planctomycetes bacterium]|nr:hypothetical protein [Planctomycetota bacterium]